MNNPGTNTWPELAIDLYDKLTARNAEICYEFEDLQVQVPSAATDTANHAPWNVSGTLKIRTRDLAA